MTVRWLTGDVMEQVQCLDDDSVDLVVGSPPFLLLRDYAGMPGQWGGEPDPASYLDHLLELAVELRRVLTPHGSIAFELGDTYSGSGGGGGDYAQGGQRNDQRRARGSAKARRSRRRDQLTGIIPPDRRPGPAKRDDIAGWPLAKSLSGTPTLFAWSLAYGRNLLRHPRTTAETIRWHRKLMHLGMSDTVAAYWLDAWPWPLEPHFDPWRIRNVIVWARNNPPVGSLADKVRPATSYITVATQSTTRWFDLDAVRGPGSPKRHARTAQGIDRQAATGKHAHEGRGGNWATLDTEHIGESGAPPLDHWTDEYDGDLTWLINTAGSSLAHFAMWPAKLAERLILSMCPAQVCRQCGEPRRRLTERTRVRLHDGERNPQRVPPTRVDGNGSTAIGIRHGMGVEIETLGWSDCGHNNYRAGHVLDPFAGTGTTLAVADIHGRDAIGIDLDPVNQNLYGARYAEVKKALFDVGPPVEGQLALTLDAA